MFIKKIPFMFEARSGMAKRSIGIGSKLTFDDGPHVITKIHTVEVLNGGICRVIGMCKPDKVPITKK